MRRAAINEETNTVKLRASLTNRETLLRPGMFCKARIAQGTVEIGDGLQAGETVVTEGAFLLKSDILGE